MLGTTYAAEICSSARALELVGERWTLPIIRKARFAGSVRFNDFRVLGIAANMLKMRLNGLVVAGIMEKVDSPQKSDASEYRLTDKGVELTSVLIALTEWGDRWAAPKGPPVIYTHAECRSDVHLVIECDSCGPLTRPSEVGVRPGPGMPAETAAKLNGH